MKEKRKREEKIEKKQNRREEKMKNRKKKIYSEIDSNAKQQIQRYL